MSELTIDKKKTAVVVIDLQKGIVAMPVKPYSANEVISNASKIVESCRKNNIPVFLVHVNPSKDTALKPIVDVTFSGRINPPKDWAELIPELNVQDSDIIIKKQQWGAFFGTDLDLQLRRRKIDTIILCGIATSLGVESTARFAYEYGYNQIFAEDAMSSMTAEEHNSSVNNIFKRMGLVRKTSEIIYILN